MFLPTKNVFECCGCGACAAVCPYDAIEMKADTKGFSYPEIDEKRCIQCHKCESVCAFDIESTVQEDYAAEAYGAKIKDEKARMCSRSGGAFTALSNVILNEGGVVYGCVLNEKFFAVHKRAESKEERDEFRGSKYIQSDLTGIYDSLRKDLEAGRSVLFSGTTCQIAAIRKYVSMLHINDDKLYLVDIICLGVPSPKVFRDSLNYIEKKHHCKVHGVNFRNKEKFGWNSHIETVMTNKQNYDDRYFPKLFFTHNILRDSCFHCPYRNTVRCGDISLGDFWGIENVAPEMNDNKGVSLVLLHNEKGKSLFHKCKEEIIAKEFLIKDCLQPSLYEQVKEPEDREKFWKKYDKYGISGAIFDVNIRTICSRITRLFQSRRSN